MTNIIRIDYLRLMPNNGLDTKNKQWVVLSIESGYRSEDIYLFLIKSPIDNLTD